MTQYLEAADALQVTERYGFYVRDAGLLASALARPSASMFGTDAYATFDRKAAALLESLVRNHPLVDGNKRTGDLRAGTASAAATMGAATGISRDSCVTCPGLSSSSEFTPSSRMVRLTCSDRI